MVSEAAEPPSPLLGSGEVGRIEKGCSIFQLLERLRPCGNCLFCSAAPGHRALLSR